MFRRSAFVLNTEVEDSDSQETQCDELRQLVDAERCGTVYTLTTECKVAQSISRNRHSDAEMSWIAWSLSRVPGRSDDHRMSAHEAKVSVA